MYRNVFVFWVSNLPWRVLPTLTTTMISVAIGDLEDDEENIFGGKQSRRIKHTVALSFDLSRCYLFSFFS